MTDGVSWKPLLLVSGLWMFTCGAAQAADAPNMCSAGTKRASIAVGSAESKSFAASREIGGWLTFTDLDAIGKSLWAICLGADGSQVVHPLAADVKECQTKAGVLRCSKVVGELETSIASAASHAAAAQLQERESVPTKGLPDAVVAYATRWANGCRQNGDVPQFAANYITPVDLDGDGDGDFILNGDGETCVDSKTGGVTAAGGGNGGTSLVMFLNAGRAFKKLDFSAQSAEILRFKGFGVAVIEGSEGRQVFRLEEATATTLKTVPSGGKRVYTLSR